MALLFSDGFDCYASRDDAIAGGWLALDPSATNRFSTTNGRYGGGCLQGSSNAGNTCQWLTSVYVANAGTIIICFAYYHTGAGGTADRILEAMDVAGARCFSLKHNTSGDLSAFDRSDVQAGSTATAALTANVWHSIEISVLLKSDATGTINVHVDGNSVISVTAKNTEPATNLGCNNIGLGGNAGTAPSFRVDDVIIMDASGSTMNGFLGATRIDTLKPNVAGGVTDWTASSSTQLSCVDDTPNAANDDTDYIYSSTAAQEARFGFEDLAVEPNSIFSVQLRMRGRKPDAGTRTYRGLLYSSATESLGATVGFPATYSWRRMLSADKDPNGNVTWTASRVNSLQAGVEIVA